MIRLSRWRPVGPRSAICRHLANGSRRRAARAPSVVKRRALIQGLRSKIIKISSVLHRAATYHDAEVERSLEAGKGEPGTTPDMLTGNLMRRAAPQSVSSISGARSSLVSGAWMGGFNEDIVDARRCAVRASDSWAESALSVIFRTESARAAAAAIKYPVA